MAQAQRQYRTEDGIKYCYEGGKKYRVMDDMVPVRQERGCWVQPHAIRQCFGFDDEEMKELLTEFARQDVDRHRNHGFEANRAIKIAREFAHGDI